MFSTFISGHLCLLRLSQKPRSKIVGYQLYYPVQQINSRCVKLMWFKTRKYTCTVQLLKSVLVCLFELMLYVSINNCALMSGRFPVFLMGESSKFRKS